MKFTGAIDYRIDGAELLRKDRNCIIVANHPSLIDYVLIASQLPQCDCLVKAAIWENPFMKRIVKAAGYIPNQAPDDLLERCEERFSRGNVLLVFPEGTRTTPGIEPSLQRGAAQIATRTQTDLRVIHITVSPTFLTKEKKCELKQLIIDALNLEDMSIDEIETEAPLFGDGLGLDSIDALELGLAIKKKYNIVIDADDSNTRQHFSSVENLANYISSQTNN
ncbi:UNVERIFIED_CONTAM: hypothetical protein GTU68_003982 [Idotea baltica]|nr:hypothetical protein [Idotea baltica]